MIHTSEHAACGVGLIASRQQQASHALLQHSLRALASQEHRGGSHIDQKSSDGCGLMTDIPFELLGYAPGSIALAMIFAPPQAAMRRACLRLMEEVFAFHDMPVLSWRKVPTCTEVLGKEALQSLPFVVQAIIARPDYCRTEASFEKQLYTARQNFRHKSQQKGLSTLFFCSLSPSTIVYKALCLAADLPLFYQDLQNPAYKTRFGLFHRRFSTNTNSTWDKAQPFRLIAHNGEFNTISGNRSWAISREKASGLPKGSLLSSEALSDSGSLNEMMEAMHFRSSIPYTDEILALLMPPAYKESSFYRFWGRALEAWDGPALVLYADGHHLGARLDRNGFRPCRWALTEMLFCLASEAGSFQLEEGSILAKGTLQAGTGLRFNMLSGKLHLQDPSQSRENADMQFQARLFPLHYLNATQEQAHHLAQKHLFQLHEEELSKILLPMIQQGKEAIGSMGDTARLAVLSSEPHSLFDYFYHHFAQVSNPPLDYLREKSVTDLSVYLGRRPNIFAKKELIPPPPALALASPLLSLGQMEYLRELAGLQKEESQVLAREYAIVFEKKDHPEALEDSFRSALEALCKCIEKDVAAGVSIVILSDSQANYSDKIPMPCLLAMRAVIRHLREAGLRLKFSMVLHSGQVRNTHQIACSITLGAAAVCPYLALEIARFEPHTALKALSADIKEKKLIKAYEDGLLKIMAKMGISVLRSYQSAQLLSCIGLGPVLVGEYFEGINAYLGGLSLVQVLVDWVKNIEKQEALQEEEALPHHYFYKEHNKGLQGEKHAMTNSRSKLIHDLAKKTSLGLDQWALYEAYLQNGLESAPIHLRHLLDFRKGNTKNLVSPDLGRILASFGSGAMSFGAISAEAQRDIILAMQQVGGRSNSGEGGENPYYFTESISASTKQIASGRFGVNARYLISGEEIQIKIAQGAKPGEGGQLMAAKVDVHIAKARYSPEQVDLISPPPMHDIYSIEDLKQLIYELKQVHPQARISVKLVSGAGIGTIAVGVVKAGADIIHISGGDGGTGAASLSSMKHAGLPLEFGLWEVHCTLLAQGLRHIVKLRADGGLHSGHDIVVAAILGAEEFDFGKLLLVAQGCVMARICEKNTCPTGIATHDPRFKAKYKGSPEDIVKVLHYLAEDVRRHLVALGKNSLQEIIGHSELLEVAALQRGLVQEKGIDLTFLLGRQAPYLPAELPAPQVFQEGIGALNSLIMADTHKAIVQHKSAEYSYPIQSQDRAVLSTLSGYLAQQAHQGNPFEGQLSFVFRGSAGQGFAAFLGEGLCVRLYGEANDSVAKSMSGGKLVIRPPQEARFEASKQVIIGNAALYGATGGLLYVAGIAGDRFAVRNSGAIAVAEGAGLHACEYMTGGLVWLLGDCSYNVGSGMTGGELYLFQNQSTQVNLDYLCQETLDKEDYERLKALLSDYQQETQSPKALAILERWAIQKDYLKKYVPKHQARQVHSRAS